MARVRQNWMMRLRPKEIAGLIRPILRPTQRPKNLKTPNREKHHQATRYSRTNAPPRGPGGRKCSFFRGDGDRCCFGRRRATEGPPSPSVNVLPGTVCRSVPSTARASARGAASGPRDKRCLTASWKAQACDASDRLSSPKNRRAVPVGIRDVLDRVPENRSLFLRDRLVGR
jgi:hypothetical protein